MTQQLEGNFNGNGLRIGIVATRWNDFMGHRMQHGAVSALHRMGVNDDDITIATVPGCFEIPLVAQKMAASKKYDAIICLGVLIRGSTIHFDLIASEATKGVGQAALQSGIPVAFGIITTENIEQAIERAGSKVGNKGEEAAMAAIEMATLLKVID